MAKSTLVDLLVFITLLLTQLSLSAVLPTSHRHHEDKHHNVSSVAKSPFFHSAHFGTTYATSSRRVKRQYGYYPPPALTSTVFSTSSATITTCGQEVDNCPAHSTVAAPSVIVVSTITAISINGALTTLVLPNLPKSSTTITVGGQTFVPGPCSENVFFRLDPTSTTGKALPASPCSGSVWLWVSSSTGTASSSGGSSSNGSAGIVTTPAATPSPTVPSNVANSVASSGIVSNNPTPSKTSNGSSSAPSQASVINSSGTSSAGTSGSSNGPPAATGPSSGAPITSSASRTGPASSTVTSSPATGASPNSPISAGTSHLNSVAPNPSSIVTTSGSVSLASGTINSPVSAGTSPVKSVVSNFSNAVTTSTSVSLAPGTPNSSGGVSTSGTVSINSGATNPPSSGGTSPVNSVAPKPSSAVTSSGSVSLAPGAPNTSGNVTNLGTLSVTSGATNPSSVGTSSGPASLVSTGVLPSGASGTIGVPTVASVATVTSAGQTFFQTFVPTTYSQFASLTGPTIETIVIAGTSIPIVVGSGGVGWALPSISVGEPRAPAPSSLPLPAQVSSGVTTRAGATVSPPSGTGVGSVSGAGATNSPLSRTGVGSLSSGAAASPAPTVSRGLKITVLDVISGTTSFLDSVTGTTLGDFTSITTFTTTVSTQPACTKTCNAAASDCATVGYCTYTITDMTTTKTATISGVTSNTEISGGGGGNGGSKTCTPFLWRCWFCDAVGIALGKLPCLPGIYIPHPPPFPGFPRITIGHNLIPTVGPPGEPEDGGPPTGTPSSTPTSKATSSSSEKCTTKTASDCFVQCTASPTVVSGTTSFPSTCKTTCSQTVGCSAAPSTTTSATTTSGSTRPVITLTEIEVMKNVATDTASLAPCYIAEDVIHLTKLGISIPSLSWCSRPSSSIKPTTTEPFVSPVPAKPASTVINTTITPPPQVAGVRCSNPSLEDSDGLCTCSEDGQIIGTFTPSGGPGNPCQMTTIGAGIASDFPTPSPTVVKTTIPVPTTTAASVLDCSNPSLEDSDGLCTCSAGGKLVGTYTPSGGPGNACPTVVPK